MMRCNLVVGPFGACFQVALATQSLFALVFFMAMRPLSTEEFPQFHLRTIVRVEGAANLFMPTKYINAIPIFTALLFILTINPYLPLLPHLNIAY